METLTTLSRKDNMYNVDDFAEISTLNIKDLNNRLFATFTTLDELDGLLENITSQYDILYRKIFVLYIKSNDEYVCT